MFCEFSVKCGDFDLCFILLFSVLEGIVGYILVIFWCFVYY